MYSCILKTSMCLGLLAIVCLTSCKKENNNKKDPVRESSLLKGDALLDQLKIKPGESVELDIPLDDLCGFLGDPGQDCREQRFASDFSYFRMYPAIRNLYPAMVITKVGANKQEVINEDGSSGFLLASLGKEEEPLQTVSIDKAEATASVNKFRRYFPGAPQIWTVNYQQLLDLFSTSGQWVPEGEEPIRNHLQLEFSMQQDRSIDLALNTCFGNAVIGRFYLREFIPVWIDVCPGQCETASHYFLPV